MQIRAEGGAGQGGGQLWSGERDRALEGNARSTSWNSVWRFAVWI